MGSFDPIGPTSSPADPVPSDPLAGHQAVLAGQVEEPAARQAGPTAQGSADTVSQDLDIGDAPAQHSSPEHDSDASWGSFGAEGFPGPDVDESSPHYLVDNLTNDRATQILKDWLAHRTRPDVPEATGKTKKDYAKKARFLVANYAEQLGLDVASIDPLQIVHCFIDHSRNLGLGTWKTYRFCLLHLLQRQVIELEAQGIPHALLVKALAGLITISRKPYEREENSDLKKDHVKSISRQHFDVIVDELANGAKSHLVSHQRALHFAIVTLETGLRPGEWRDAQMRSALAEDFSDGTDPTGWSVLVVNTAKRKGTEDQWKRSILIPPRSYQVHIAQHMRLVKDYLAKAKRSDADPMEDYTHVGTLTLGRICKEVFKTHPDRWITIYTLRSQARANFVYRFGKFIGAAMMGHGPKVSSSFYAGINWVHRPKKGGGMGLVPKPGLDCMAHATLASAHSQKMAGAESAPADAPKGPGQGS